VPVDPLADGNGGDAGDKKPKRQRPVRIGLGPAEIGFHRRDDDREAVVEGAPDDELPDG
jgi:hypothetical protein